jgi:hypothetical protein
MKESYPQAGRQLEYVAFFDFQVPTMEGPGHVFMAVDAYSQFAFLLGVERDKSPKSVLKNIYALIENKDFGQYLNKGWKFTLVLKEYEELSKKIENMIEPFNGKLLFDQSFCQYLANPVLQSLSERFFRQ